MGRWRPPTPASSPYITSAGFRRLQEELKSLWPRRREVVAALAAAAAEGDRSENAEYIYRKKQLGGLDRRIRYLQKRLPVLKAIEATPDTETIRFGAWITLEDQHGNIRRYRIVGADEIDHQSGYISIDAPVARALLGKSVDAEVTISVGEKTTVFQVIEVVYPD